MRALEFKPTFDHRVPQFLCEKRVRADEAWANKDMLQTRYLWIQDMVAAISSVIKEVPTADTITDSLTNAIDRKNLDRHLTTIGFVEVQAIKLHTPSLMRRRRHAIENELETPTWRHESSQQQCSSSSSSIKHMSRLAVTNGHTFGTKLTDANSCVSEPRHDGFRQSLDDGTGSQWPSHGNFRDPSNIVEATNRAGQAISQGNFWNLQQAVFM